MNCQVKGKVQKDLKHKSSVPMEADEPTSWHMDLFIKLEFSRPQSLRIFMEASPCKHDHLWTQHLFSLSKGWRMGLKVPSFSPWLAVWVTRPRPEAIQETRRSHPIRTKDVPNTQETVRGLGTPCKMLLLLPSLRKLQEFYDFVSETRIKDKILEKKMLLLPLSFRKLQGFRSSLSWTKVRDQICISKYVTASQINCLIE